MNPFSRKILVLWLALLPQACVSVNADTLPPPPPSDTTRLPSQKIVEINYCGNRVTNPRMLRIYLGIDTGMVYDSALIAAGKKRLMDTYLFSKVEVLRLQKIEGVHVFVLVTEFFYWFPSGGGDIIEGRYGDPKQVWYRLRLGIGLQNFRGLFETFSIGATVWDDKALSISWSKPFVPSPYFFSIGAAAEEYPDLSFPRRRLVANARVTLGRRFFANSRSYVSISPSYNKITRVDSTDLPDSRVTYDEMVTQWGWVTDRKNRSYDPTAGWYIHTSLTTNALYAGANNPFLQWSNDLRLYHEGFFSFDRFACKITTAFRSNDAGPYRALYIGGDGSVRGWARDQLGLTAIMNDYAVWSGEYRFPIWRPTPSFDLPIVCDYAPSLRGFYLRADGAVILDAGEIWHDIAHPFAVNEDGEGFGFGIRIMAPTLLRSGSFDVVWPFQDAADPRRVRYSLTPAWHLYLDMNY